MQNGGTFSATPLTTGKAGGPHQLRTVHLMSRSGRLVAQDRKTYSSPCGSCDLLFQPIKTHLNLKREGIILRFICLPFRCEFDELGAELRVRGTSCQDAERRDRKRRCLPLGNIYLSFHRETLRVADKRRKPLRRLHHGHLYCR